MLPLPPGPGSDLPYSPAPNAIAPADPVALPRSIVTWGNTLAGALVPYPGSRPSVAGSFLPREGGLYLSSSRLAPTRNSLITVELMAKTCDSWPVKLSVCPCSYAVASLDRGSWGTYDGTEGR